MTTLATQFQLDCALMAGAVYVFNRNAINQLPVPPGWTLGKYQSENTGFEAASFIDGSQIVISYAGTAPITLSIPAGQDRDDILHGSAQAMT